jgi:acyl carrier protein phosphodiesterase
MLSRQAADRLNRGTGDRQDAIYLRDTMGDNDLSRNFFEQNAKSPLGGGMGDLLQQLSTDQAEERKRIADAVTKLNSENFVDTMEEGLAKIAERLQGMPDAIRRAEAPIQRAVDQFIDAIQRLEDRVAKQANALELEEIKRIKGKAGRGGVRG